MTADISIKDDSLSPAIGRYIALSTLRGRTVEQAMKKIMRFWVSFALAKIPRGDQVKIMADLRALTRQAVAQGAARAPRRGAKGAKSANEWRGTVAAATVAKLNYKNARGLAPGPFYRLVGQFAGRRSFAANLHKAGLLPALEALRERRPERLPRFAKAPPGGYLDRFTEDFAGIMVDNWASAAPVPGRPAPKGVAGLAGDAFTAALPEVEAQLRRWMVEDLSSKARLAGFQVS